MIIDAQYNAVDPTISEGENNSLRVDVNGRLLVSNLNSGATANGVNTTGTGYQAISNLGQFDDVSPSAVTENQFGPLRISSERFLYTAEAPSTSVGAGLVSVRTSVAAGSLVAKASAGNLYGLNVKAPSGAAAMNVMVIDSATVPADGTVTPTKVYDLAAAGTLSVFFDPPIRFTAGCVVVLSTTGPFSKTIALTTNLSFISADIA